MSSMEASYSITRHPVNAEVEFVTRGLYTFEKAVEFVKDMAHKCAPLIEARTPFRVLGDMTDYVAQNREVADLVQKQLVEAKSVGLERVAILGASALVKLQYARLAEGIDVQYFDEKAEALAWLREPA